MAISFLRFMTTTVVIGNVISVMHAMAHGLVITMMCTPTLAQVLSPTLLDAGALLLILFTFQAVPLTDAEIKLSFLMMILEMIRTTILMILKLMLPSRI